MSKKVWFSLPVDFSPEFNSTEDSQVGREFHKLLEDSEELSELSQYSYTTPQQSRVSDKQLSQYSCSPSQQQQASGSDLSQYSVATMDTNSTNETYSTNESQDISSSQQSSEANLSQCGLDEGNSVASSVQESQHDEVVNSAIMEVSGELMLGKLSQQKYPSGGSESSDISDDDSRRLATGGAIVKYPESSTGMSDNDWNPYATESDTNQTPRSAASDELMLASKDPVTTVSMVTGEVFTSKGLDNQPHLGSGTFADEYRVLPRTESESYKPRYREDIPDPMRQNGSDDRSTRLDILRQMIGDDSTEDFLQIEKPFLSDYRAEKPLDIDTPPRDRDDELGKSMESTKSSKSDSDPSQKSQGGFSRESEETLKGRDSTESAKSLELHAPDNNKEPRKSTDSAGSGEHSRRESGESVRSHHSVRDGRHSAESGISDEIRRESTESYRSLPDMGGRSGRQSSETSKSPRSGLQSVESWRSPRSDKSEGSHGSGRESAESQQSPKSDRSRGSDYSGRSQKSHASAGSAAGTDRLDRLNEVGDSVKELMQFEAAQRKLMDGFEREPMSVSKINPRSESPRSNEVSRRVRLTDNFEAYTAPTKTASTLTRSSGAEYVSVTEREKLLSESPGFSELTYHTQKEQAVPFKPELELKGTSQQDMKYTSSRITDAGLRSPSEVSMKRVSDLFEETKKQSRAAVSLPRPDPSGSEERFPLQERLSLSQHVDDSFKTHDRTGHSEKSRDSETARSITSEEVARVLGKHVDTEADLKRRKPEKDKENREPLVKISAFDKVDRNTNAINDALGDIKYDAAHYADMSDDEIAKRVRAILSDTEYLGIVGGNGKTLPRGELQDSDTSEKYVPHTIDYSKLQRDLQEIQDTLHDVPPPKANDSLYHLRKMKEAEADQNQSGTSESGHFKSAETTSTSGRESGISNFGRKLAWDHAADLQYDEGYTGQFYGTMTSTDTDTLIGTQRLRKSGTLESDNLMVRAESTTTNESEPDGPDFPPQDTEAAAQSIVDQVLSRHAEGPLQENVEDIIARYRNERQDLFDKYQPEKEGPTYKIPSLPQQLNQNQSAIQRPLLSQPEPDKLTTHLSSAATSASGPKQNADAQPGLAERVYKILTSDEQPESYRAPPPHLEQGMAKKVYKILSADRPGSQVNGILTDAVEKEHEMLKKLVEQRHAEDDSSLEVPPRLNGTSDSFALSEKDVRRQLEWSLISSPDKTGVSDLSTIRKVTSAPYSSVDNAKTVLSSQLQKMSERNFDKSVELRTPYRQAIDCYPVYGVERDSKKQEPEQKGREAWMPVPNPSRLSPEKVGEKKTDALASERFFLTHKDHSPLRDQGERRTESPQRQRTYSDPFEISPSRRSTERGQHPRSKSQEDTDVSDLSQYSVYDPTDRRAASSSHRLDLRGDEARRKPDDAGFMTPAKHKPQEWSYEPYSCSDSSDMYYHSDSSEGLGNKWRNHGYQLYRKKDRHKDKSSSNNVAHKYSEKNHSFATFKDFKNYYLQEGVLDRQSQSLGREDKNVGSENNFRDDMYFKYSFEKDNYEPMRKKPLITKDDVYDLLSKSRAQETKVAELQSKNNVAFKGKNNAAPQGEDNAAVQSRNNATLQSNFNAVLQGGNNLQHKAFKPYFADNYGNTHSPQRQGHDMPSGRINVRNSGHETISPTESDSSGSKKLSKLRPYRPAGSRDVYYTESGDDTNESGTTIESTHPGSDDAIPPYIPTQYMGSRQDEPAKHPIGIYGTNSKDALSTIDEKSVGDDREKALSVSTTSAKDEPGKKLNRESSAKVRDPDYLLRARSPYNERSREPVSKGRATLSIDSDAGYQTGAVGKSSKEDSSREAAITEKRKDEARLRELEIRRKLETVRNRNIDMGNFYSSASRQETLEGPELKTREEYLRELEAREREILIRAQYSEEKHDPLGTTVRSDPGGSLEDHRDIHDLGVFKRLEPEPLYPQERIRYSRSRSETDLTAMSPVESQKYSSPMQPGTRFMELSSQPSPISHQESLSLRNREPGVSRDPVRQIGRLDDITSRRARSPADHRDHVRELAIDREGIRNRERVELDRETRYPLERRLEMQEYPLELPIVTERRASQDDQPRQSRLYQTQGRTEVERIVDSVSGKDTRKSPHDHLEAKSPLCVREKELERELEEMNREIAAQVKEAQGKAVDEKEEFEDNFPPSKKAQVLREVLEQEYMDNIPPNINDMWSRFKELNSQSDRESSLNSTRLDALSGLLKNPVHHDVNTFLEEKSEEKERRQLEAEQAERVKAERLAIIEREKRLAQEKAAEERILKRKERQQLRLSGEESNGSYSEILYEKEKQEKVKGRHRNKEGLRGSKDKKTRTPDPNKEKGQKKSKKGKENEIKEKVEVKQKYSKSSNSKKEIKNPVVNLKYQHSDSMDTLFSIPEDASFDISPTKAESEMKARQKRQRHVIDPLMKKLRDKIKLQRDKIDKERRKELQRVEKLKKLEMLLTAKRKGKLSDKAIDVELENVSSTTSVSQSEASATLSEATLTAGSTTMESDGSSQGSTTLKDTSSFESPRLQYKKYPEEAFAGHKKVYQESESSASASQSESSDFSNIIVERVPERKPDRRAERRSTEKKSKSKEKKAKVDDSGHKIRKEKKKKEVFGVELSDDALAKQLRRYERYISPERVGKQRDAATMYPSPITVSPPSRRRLRDVYMKSEAIQTSPSVRSTSPCHTYDEVPVAPVPLMGQGRVLGQSPSPARSRSPALPAPRRISKSPVDKSRSRSAGSRKSSRSPSAGTQTDISSPVSKSKTSSRTRSKKAQSPMWKPETPPRNRMFEPETPDENREPFTKTEDPPGALSWFVSLKPSEPWRKPLKERQAFSVSREPWEPKSVSQSTWKNMVHGDVLKDKSDVSNVSRDTKFELDTTGQPIRDEESMSESEESDLEVLQSKPLTKMTLQEAFLQRKQNTLSRLRERQKRLNLAAEERKMQAYLQLERDRLFQEERRKEANPEAHPYSDNLFRPARRVISKEEMKEMTQRKYKKLPEVVEQEKLKKRTEQYGLNRLKARLFNRKVQRHVLVKAQKWGR